MLRARSLCGRGSSLLIAYNMSSDDDSAAEDDCFPEPSSEPAEETVQDIEVTLRPHGSAKWLWLVDEILLTICRAADVDVLFTVSALDRRSHLAAEARVSRVLPLTRPPFSLGRRHLIPTTDEAVGSSSTDPANETSRARGTAVKVTVGSLMQAEAFAAAITRAGALTHVTGLAVHVLHQPQGTTSADAAVAEAPRLARLVDAWRGGAMPALTRLGLEGASVNEAVKGFADAICSGMLPQLRELGLRWCGLTDASLLHLQRAAAALEHLTRIDLSANGDLSAQAVNELRAALPTVPIQLSPTSHLAPGVITDEDLKGPDGVNELNGRRSRLTFEQWRRLHPDASETATRNMQDILARRDATA